MARVAGTLEHRRAHLGRGCRERAEDSAQCLQQRARAGAIEKREQPIAASKVMLVDPKTGKGTRVRVKTDDKGHKVRVAVKSGEEALLCWHLGEDDIRYWHTVDGGFAGRRPLPVD